MLDHLRPIRVNLSIPVRALIALSDSAPESCAEAKAIAESNLHVIRYHTQRDVRSMYSTLRVAGHHGCMTFPMIWDSQQMGDLYLRRWDVTDVQDLLRLKDADIVVLEREFVIYW